MIDIENIEDYLGKRYITTFKVLLHQLSIYTNRCKSDSSIIEVIYPHLVKVVLSIINTVDNNQGKLELNLSRC